MNCAKIVNTGAWLFVFFWFLVHIPSSVVSGPIYSNYGPECREAYSCVNNTTLKWDSYGYIRCSGYHSCSQISKIEVTGTAYLMCGGSYSCYNADVLYHDGSGRPEIQC